MRPLLIKFIIILSAILLSEISFAEAPCTYIGQDSLEALRACVRSRPASAPYQDVHHHQIMNHLANSQSAQPQSYYSATGAQTFMSQMILAEGLIHGFRNMPLAYPMAWYIFNSPYLMP